MNDSPLVSIIIVNFNGQQYLKRCLDSLLDGTYKNIEIIFVDNGSTDGSSDFVKTKYPQVIIIDNKTNLGLSVASNQGARAAKGEYLFFYNNDTIADRNLVNNLVKVMEEDAKIGICGCKTYAYDGKYLINAGVSCDIFGYPYGKGKPFYIDAAIFIRKDIFVELGGFDEKMFLYGEDRDICWRNWLNGYKVVVVNDAVFYHDSACITKDIKQYSSNIRKRFLSEFNSLRSILKNYSMGFLFFILPLFIAINISEVLIFFVKGEFRLIKSVYIKSYMENLKNIQDTLKKRRRIQNERKISDFQLLRHMDKVSGKLRLFLDIGIPQVK